MTLPLACSSMLRIAFALSYLACAGLGRRLHSQPRYIESREGERPQKLLKSIGAASRWRSRSAVHQPWSTGRRRASDANCPDCQMKSFTQLLLKLNPSTAFQPSATAFQSSSPSLRFSTSSPSFTNSHQSVSDRGKLFDSRASATSSAEDSEPAQIRRTAAGLKVAVGAALGNILQGFNTGVIAAALLGIIPEFGLATRPAITGLIASSTTMGAIIGTVFSGFLCDWAGRRTALVLSSALYMLGGGLMGWSPGCDVLVLGRIVSGIAAGLCSAAVPTYIAECAEAKQRGQLSIVPQLFVSSGILLSYLIGLGALIWGQSWRRMLCFSLIPAAIQAVFVATLPESPRWLLAKKKNEEGAMRALRRLRGTDDERELREELEAMREGLKRESAREKSQPNTDSKEDESPNVVDLVQHNSSRRALFVCSALQFFQQFCGVNAIVYFTPQILKQAGAHALFASRGFTADVTAMLATVLAYLPKIPSVLLAGYLIDRLGRRGMLLWFIPPLAACLYVLSQTVGNLAAGAAASASGAWAATAAVTLFGVFFGMSLGPLPNILSAELFAMRNRAAGVSATTTVQWSSNMLVAALFPVASSHFGMSRVLQGFALVCIAAELTVLFNIKETKGVNLEDIGDEDDTAHAGSENKTRI